MKKCFTINPLRSLEEIRSYHILFQKDIFQAVEIFYPNPETPEQFNDYTKGIQEIYDEFPFIEFVIHLPFGIENDLCNLTRYKDVVLKVKDAITYASKFDVNKATLHLGYLYSGTARQHYLNHINDVLIDLCEFASEVGIDIMIENMPSDTELGYTPDEILNIIVNTGMSNLKFILDTGHANVSAYSIESYLVKLSKYLLHIHLNDNNGVRDEHLPLGAGTINFPEFFNKIRMMNYRKLFCLEILYDTVDDLIDYANTLNKYDKN